MTDDRQTIVIVGGVAGGASAAARARRMNEQARIIIFEKDEYISFANCGLPYYIGGEITEHSSLLLATPQKFAQWFNIDVHPRHEVLRIDREAKTVQVRDIDGEREFAQSYDRLILAPGADPVMPPIEGLAASNVFTLRNVPDADAIRAYIDEEPPQRAVVVGAGYIGLEMVEMLHHRGMEVAVVEMLDQVLPPLDPEMAHMVEVELERHDVQVHTGAAMSGVQRDEQRVTAVELADGTKLPADLVIVGAGVRPKTKLAVEAGLDIGAGGGIAVNEYMQTSDPAVYAVGDAAEYVHGVLDKAMRIPLAGPANRAGRVAGEHAATDTGPTMPKALGTSIVRVFDLTAAGTGLNMKTAEKEGLAARAVWVPGNHHVTYYPGAQEMMIKLVYEAGTGRILGAQAVGGQGVDKRIDVIATAMHFGGKIDDLAGLDLTYAPPYGAAKDPVHLAAFTAQNDLRDLDHLEPPTAVGSFAGRVQLVDVRTAEEWEAGRLDGALWIPLHELRGRVDELDRTKPVVTYCKGGQRSYYATRLLRQHGFADVRTLSGGMVMQAHV
jgi:NADPH-dependent 2,4-dienoyl-CoA reductase/sulfur reductase-like enzyme/rhodanese-related sulfurtransferase